MKAIDWTERRGETGAPRRGPRGIVLVTSRRPLRNFVLLCVAALGCFVGAIVLDTLLHPSPEGRLALAAVAFAGYLFLGRRALYALVPEIDRRWRKGDSRFARIVALAALLTFAPRLRAQSPPPPDAPPSPPTASFGGWVEAGYAANFDRPALAAHPGNRRYEARCAVRPPRERKTTWS